TGGNRGAGRRTTVGGKTWRNVQRDDGALARVDGGDRRGGRPARRSVRPRAEQRVHDDIGVAERLRQDALVSDDHRAEASASQGGEFPRRIARDLFRSSREPHGDTSAALLEEASDDEAVTAVATLATLIHHARAPPPSGQEPDDVRDGAATRVLHEGRAGSTERVDGPAIEPAHLLGAQDRQHVSAAGWRPG